MPCVAPLGRAPHGSAANRSAGHSRRRLDSVQNERNGNRKSATNARLASGHEGGAPSGDLPRALSHRSVHPGTAVGAGPCVGGGVAFAAGTGDGRALPKTDHGRCDSEPDDGYARVLESGTSSSAARGSHERGRQCKLRHRGVGPDLVVVGDGRRARLSRPCSLHRDTDKELEIPAVERLNAGQRTICPRRQMTSSNGVVSSSRARVARSMGEPGTRCRGGFRLSPRLPLRAEAAGFIFPPAPDRNDAGGSFSDFSLSVSLPYPPAKMANSKKSSQPKNSNPEPVDEAPAVQPATEHTDKAEYDPRQAKA